MRLSKNIASQKRALSAAYIEGQEKVIQSPHAMYDNPHHPSTQAFNDYSEGWINERLSQNEKHLSALDNQNRSLVERQNSYDLLARDAIRENNGKMYVRTPNSQSELGSRPVEKSAVLKDTVPHKAERSIARVGEPVPEKISDLDKDIDRKFAVDDRGRYHWKENPDILAFREKK